MSDFSPDGKLFALLDVDGKLRIWDIEENRLSQEYDPTRVDSNVRYTCFIWFTRCTKHLLNGSSTIRTNTENTTVYMALGTTKGGVDLYSYAIGKVNDRFFYLVHHFTHAMYIS